MADRKNHITNSEDYKRYLDHKMTPQERHDFEKLLLDDAFENEAFDGLSQITPEEISMDLNSLGKQIKSKTEKKDYAIFWRIAATLLLLAVFSFIIYLTIDLEPKPKIAQNKKVESEKPEKDGSEPVQSFSLDSDSSVDEDSDAAPAIVEKTKMEGRSSESYDKQDQGQFNDSEFEDNSIAEASDEFKDDQKQNELEPLELPEFALEQSSEIEEIGELEIESIQESDILEEDKNSRAKVMTAAPAVLKKMESSSARNRSAPKAYQLRTITGNVSSIQDGESLPGVNVMVKGSTIGTITDADGKYSISIPEGKKASLVFSYIGFMSEEVEVGTNDVIDVNIEPDESSLSEIVVVGFGASNDYQRPDYTYQPPHPVGGNTKFKEYIRENMRYPSDRISEGIKGTVNVKVTVGAYGQISNLEVLKSLGEKFDEEAIRLIVDGPEWEPALENDSAVIRDVKVKIRFRPPE